MDPHFHEYLAAIAGMHDVYGDRADAHLTEFHDDHTGAVTAQPSVATA
jgi:hypothetical protein